MEEVQFALIKSILPLLAEDLLKRKEIFKVETRAC